MFARKVTIRLKPHSVAEFTRRMENEIIPLLRKQAGFHDEITFIVPGGAEAFGISLWERAENAEAYNRATYPEVAKILSLVMEGTPRVETFEVTNSTFHKILTVAAA